MRVERKLPDIMFTSKWDAHSCHHKGQTGEDIEDLVKWPWWRFRLHKVKMEPRALCKSYRWILYNRQGARYVMDLYLDYRSRKDWEYPE